jgi:secondary thiamine-phosphate synthase enzyme
MKRGWFFISFTGRRSILNATYNYQMNKITVTSDTREELIDITSDVEKILRENDTSEGVCVVFTQHTTCGVTVNENADPDVQTDMLGFLKRLIPQDEPNFKHGEQNSDAHIKSSLVGCSVTVPFEKGKLLLGRWQGIYLCEFDGPRERKVIVKTL